MNLRNKLAILLSGSSLALLALGLVLPKVIAAPSAPSTFSLVVTPSPLVTTVNPGQTTNLQLKILNNGTGNENLQIAPRSFTINSNGQINFSDSAPTDIDGWLSFSAFKFSVAVGQWYQEQVRLAVPKDAGFSYSFALVISRQSNPTAPSGESLHGSLADFALINVNRPGATKQLTVPSFTVSKHVYQWLPVKLSITFDNIGNSIVRPTGNIFIERSTNSKTPISTLPVNPNGGYILPGTQRTLTSSWSNGFPVYQTITTASGATKQQLTWNWAKVSDFRFGHYNAALVAVYNNGQTDVPIEANIGFWVIPWEVLVGLIIISLLLLFGLFSIIRAIVRLIRRHRRPKSTPRHRQPPTAVAT